MLFGIVIPEVCSLEFCFVWLYRRVFVVIPEVRGCIYLSLVLGGCTEASFLGLIRTLPITSP